MVRCFFVFLLILIINASPVHAAWHEASSKHFVIYANQKGERVRAFAERLEKFHAAMAFLVGREPESPSPSNRVTVFVVSNKSNVRKLADIKSKYVAGVYRPLAGNIVAIVPKLKGAKNKFVLSPETVLRHEYAHHFLFNITSRTFPLWFQEGFAEFYAAGSSERDGSVVLGGAANHRAYELQFSSSVSIQKLLDTRGYLKSKSKKHDQFYGRSWLLYHMLALGGKRKGQLAAYEKLLMAGTEEMTAARQAFGALDQLSADLEKYRRSKKITVFQIPPRHLSTGPVTLRKLSPGEAAMMPVIMESRTGVDEQEALEVVGDARVIAAKYQDDAAVQTALAEAELDSGNHDAAIAAADRALMLDPNQVRAQIQKIHAYVGKAKDAEDKTAAWKKVRKQIVAANRVETNHPVPLIEYYQSYKASGRKPPQLAIQGLERALQIAPFDSQLRWMVANQQIIDERFGDAVRTLKPLAHNPHKSKLTNLALKLIETVEAKAKRSQPQKGHVGQ